MNDLGFDGMGRDGMGWDGMGLGGGFEGKDAARALERGFIRFLDASFLDLVGKCRVCDGRCGGSRSIV